MTTAIPVTEGQIRGGASAESYRRGHDYYRNGAVVGLVRRDTTLEAEVEGSQYEPYQVTVDFDQAGVTAAECSCPYDWGGWCKHIVAVLLAALHAPDEIETRSPLADLLAQLDRDQLLSLVTALAKQNPGLADQIEARIGTVRAQPQTALLTATLTQAAYDAGQGPVPTSPIPAAAAVPAPVRHTPIDPKPFRQQVRRILRSLDRMSSSEAYWHVSEVTREIKGLVEQARTFIRAGDGRNALAILEAITDEYMQEWTSLDDSDGTASAFFAELTDPWTEAILTADLSAEERAQWVVKFENWQGTLADYDMEAIFEAPWVAADEGWDDPAVQAALRGEAGAESRREMLAADDEDEEDDWDEEGEDETGGAAKAGDDYAADQVNKARLAILGRQGRAAEYLNFARATGQTTQLVTMLITLGRREEAVTAALSQLGRAADALIVAQALRESGDLAASLRIAEHGLILPGPKHTLADWLSDLAHGMGQAEPALRAALIAFRELPNEARYLKVRDRAQAAGTPAGPDRTGDEEAQWPPLRDELLRFIRTGTTVSADVKIGIYLSEGLLADAIAAVDTAGASSTVVERVMDAAIEKRPDWVIQAACRQAEGIMNAGKAQHYEHAVGWLQRAQAAYRAAGREAAWRTYLEGVRVKHGRKYKLMGLLDQMDS